MRIREKENLKPRSWWQTGGVADCFCEPESPEELKEALYWAKDNHRPVSVLGGGTNVLISDEGVEGLVISTGKLTGLNFKEENGFLKIISEAGVLKSALSVVFRKHRLSPALFLSGLPGDVGGGLVMNAGAGQESPCEFSHITEWFEVMTADGTKHYKKENVEWNYRGTKGWETGVIFKSGFSWPLKEDENLNQKIKTALKRRRATQPLSQPSCGSVFKNPLPRFAGELIEKAGLKGLKKGCAVISEKHGNFIVNLGGARSKDIDFLIQTARNEVKTKFHILLEPEVRYMGRWDSKRLSNQSV